MDMNVQNELVLLCKDIDGAFEARARMKDKKIEKKDYYKVRCQVLSNILSNICAKHVISMRKEYSAIKNEMFKAMELEADLLPSKYEETENGRANG